MNENCPYPLVDPETQEGFECRELSKMSEKEFDQFMKALRWDIEWSLPNLASIVELLEKFKTTPNETEKREIKHALETIFSVHSNLPEVLELETLFYLIQAEETWDWMQARNAASIIRKLIDTHDYKTGTPDPNICDEFYGMLFAEFKNPQVSIRDMTSTIQILGKDFQAYFDEMIQYEEDRDVKKKLRKIYNTIYRKK